MKDRDRPSETIDDLIKSVESAKRGSRMLDVQLAYRLGGASGATGSPTDTRLPAKWQALGDFPAIAKIMLDEGFSWQSVCDVLDCEAPAYTTSLDASIPGENIVFVIRSAKRDQWGAIHKTADGEEIFGWGATEVLARRTAALKGWKKAAAEEKTVAAAEPAEQWTEISEADTAMAEAESHDSVIDGAQRNAPLEKSIEQAMAEQEDRDWEILF